MPGASMHYFNRIGFSRSQMATMKHISLQLQPPSSGLRSFAPRSPMAGLQRNVKQGLSVRLQAKTTGGSASTSTDPVNVKKLVAFLYEDLPHLFDQEIDRTVYDDKVEFRDPITKHDSIGGYLFNVSLLKILFNSSFQLFWVKQTGPNKITMRWTMTMTYKLLPWKPELTFTGTSVMGINPQTGKFCSHVDYWDSLQKNDYFSFEALWDITKQLRMYKTPDIETPRYTVVKRTANYEIRKYEPFMVVETAADKLSGSSGFRDVVGYISGKNSTMEKIRMTTPVFTKANDDKFSDVSIQIPLPVDKDLDRLPAPDLKKLSLRKIGSTTLAVKKFSGKPTENVVRKREKELRNYLLQDNLKPTMGCQVARYNDPGSTWSFIMRNEVLIGIEEFSVND